MQSLPDSQFQYTIVTKVNFICALPQLLIENSVKR